MKTMGRSISRLVYEITNDGRTIWVNSNLGCIGRFAPYGSEVHRPIFEQGKKGECLACEHSSLPTKLTNEHWERWKEALEKHYNIPAETVEAHRPRWLQEKHAA